MEKLMRKEMCTVGRPTISHATGPGRRARGRRESGQARPWDGAVNRQGRRPCWSQMDLGSLWELWYVLEVFKLFSETAVKRDI